MSNFNAGDLKNIKGKLGELTPEQKRLLDDELCRSEEEIDTIVSKAAKWASKKTLSILFEEAQDAKRSMRENVSDLKSRR